MLNKTSLKIRIKAVKSTQKITKAMKMVAAAKLKRAQTNLTIANSYKSKFSVILSDLINSLEIEDLSLPLLENNSEIKTHLFVVTSSERGLCGSFNNSIIKYAKKQIEKITDKGITAKILCIGKKSYEQLKKDYSNNFIYESITNKKKHFDYLDAKIIAEKIINHFTQNKFDSCSIIYNKFNSVISQEVLDKQLIPISYNKNSINNNEYEYEPEGKTILKNILLEYIIAEIFTILTENFVSEQAARMTAMDNATNSASDMIKNLSLIYNRTRQADITRELIEIISGAEAL